jgi:hypothetical protein
MLTEDFLQLPLALDGALLLEVELLLEVSFDPLNFSLKLV